MLALHTSMTQRILLHLFERKVLKVFTLKYTNHGGIYG